MLRTSKSKRVFAPGCRFAIVASKYNGKYVNSMLRAAEQTLKAARAAQVHVTRVPGAFEVPVVAAVLARRSEPAFDAILCLGVILRGETTHAEHIGQGVTNALVQLQITAGIPMVHEVLLLESEAQAKARCLDPDRNRGREAALTAIEMAKTMRKLRGASADGRKRQE